MNAPPFDSTRGSGSLVNLQPVSACSNLLANFSSTALSKLESLDGNDPATSFSAVEAEEKKRYGSVNSSGISSFEILNSYIFLPSIVFLTIQASKCHLPPSPPSLLFFSLLLSDEKIMDGSNFASNVPYLSVNLKRLNGTSIQASLPFLTHVSNSSHLKCKNQALCN